MTSSRSARARARRARIRRRRAAGLFVVVAAIAAVVGDPLSGTSSSTASSSPTAAPSKRDSSSEHRTPRVSGDFRDALGQDAGAIPDGTTVFDDVVPGVANLDPDLLGALRQAASAAADDGVEFIVDSGWRSREYQAHLLQEAVGKYGSQAEAARWVATPDRSAHVSGDAVDIGPANAATWLSQHGAQFGLCPVYGNEPWHYELRADAIAQGCPAVYADPTHDPRMQQR